MFDATQPRSLRLFRSLIFNILLKEKLISYNFSNPLTYILEIIF